MGIKEILVSKWQCRKAMSNAAKLLARRGAREPKEEWGKEGLERGEKEFEIKILFSLPPGKGKM